MPCPFLRRGYHLPGSTWLELHEPNPLLNRRALYWAGGKAPRKKHA